MGLNIKYEAFNLAISTQSDALSPEDLYGEHLVQESELKQLHMASKVQPLLLWTLLLAAEVAVDLGQALTIIATTMVTNLTKRSWQMAQALLLSRSSDQTIAALAVIIDQAINSQLALESFL